MSRNFQKILHKAILIPILRPATVSEIQTLRSLERMEALKMKLLRQHARRFKERQRA
jgi:hypothetical protein